MSPNAAEGHARPGVVGAMHLVGCAVANMRMRIKTGTASARGVRVRGAITGRGTRSTGDF